MFRRAVAVLWFLAASASAQVGPQMIAGSATVDVGDVFTIPVRIADVNDLISWQFDLAFDPAIVAANAVVEGPFLPSFCTTIDPCTSFSPGVIDNTVGLISLVADSFNDLPPFPSGSGVLANITFQALAVGISPTDLQSTFLNFSDTGFETVDGQITVRSAPGDALPEPGSLAAVLLALGVLVSVRPRPARAT